MRLGLILIFGAGGCLGDGVGGEPASLSAEWLAAPPALSNLADIDVTFQCQPEGCETLCGLDGAPQTMCRSPWELRGLAQGPHSLLLTANFGSQQVNLTHLWEVDAVAPVITLLAAPPAVSNLDQASFDFACDEICTVACSMDGSVLATCADPLMVGSLGEGPHQLVYRGTDEAGNMSMLEVFDWEVDTTPPTVSLSESPSPQSVVRAARFAFGCSEMGCTYECGVDGAALASCADPLDLSGLADGPHTLDYRARDGAGNLSTTEMFGWAVDATPPVLTVSGEPPIQGMSADVTFTFSCDESPCTFECQIDNGGFTGCTSPAMFSGLPDGTHAVDIRAVDGFGNTDTYGLSFNIDSTPPQIVNAAWVSYSVIRIDMDDSLNGTVATDPSSYTIGPAEPPGLSVVSATLVDSNTVDLTVLPYHLPIDYSITADAQNLVGLTSSNLPALLDGASAGSRVAFVTSGLFTGDMSGTLGADAACQSIASGTLPALEGSFTAMLSDLADDLWCRLLGLTGKKPLCNSGTPPPLDAGPWIRMDGLPLVDGMGGIEDNDWLTTFAFNENGVPAGTSTYFHGTFAGGTVATNHCSSWMSASGMSSGWGSPDPENDLPFTLGTGPPCNLPMPIVCMQTGGAGFPLGTDYKLSGKRAFVTSSAQPGDRGGLAGADAFCQTLGDTLPSPGTFVAWLSDASDDAYCRVLGLAGRRAANCGQATLPTGSGPWVRVDGVLVANDITDLTDGVLFEPLKMDETGHNAPANSAYTGSFADGSVHGTDHCNSWMQSSGGSGRRGLSPRRDAWSSFGNNACSASHPIYCFEL